MARVFGQTDEEARRLTKDITDFGAGQALTNADLTTTIQNFGQIIERGKVMGQTIRNLTRSAFLPWDDMVTRLSKDLGISKEAVIKLQSTTEGIPADAFIKAFEAMVEEEPRFIGAAGRLARAFLPAVANVKEIGTSIFGLNVTVPVLDVLGEAVASVTDQFVTFNKEGDLIQTKRWTDLTEAAKNLGKALAAVVTEILGFLPSSEAIADSLVAAVQGMSDWIDQNRDQIVNFFKGLIKTIGDVATFIRTNLVPALVKFATWVFDNREGILNFFKGIADIIANTLVPFVENKLIPAFDTIGKWVQEHGKEINEFFSALGDIVTKVFDNLTGAKTSTSGGGLEGFLDSVLKFMDFVVKHKDEIARFATSILQLVITIQILILVFNFLVNVALTVIGVWVTLQVVVAVAALIFGLLTAPVALVTLALIGLVAWLIINRDTVIEWAATTWATVSQWAIDMSGTLDTWRADEKAKSDEWWLGAQINVGTWATNTWMSIVAWAENTSATLDQWRADNKAKNDESAAGIIASFTNWISATWGAIVAWAANTLASITQWGSDVYNRVVQWLETLKTGMITKFNNIMAAIRDMDWAGVGVSIIQGMINGVNSMADTLISIVVNIAQRALDAANNLLNQLPGIFSGVEFNANMGPTVQGAPLSSMAASALAGNQYAYTTQSESNYNLTIHSSGGVEPIIQDFELMRSLQGG